MQTKRLTTMGLMVALAFLLSYLESLLPLYIMIPGIKIGLANLVIFAALYLLGERDAFLISLVRMILVAFTFSNLFSFLYSLAGGILSFLGMCLMRRGKFGKIAVSVTGGILHNIGQIAMAVILMRTTAIISWLPALLLSGTIAGALIGLAGGLVLQRIEKAVKV